jgi:hypothetical protein
MKIDKITFQGKFSVMSAFLDETIGAEGTLEEGEEMEDALLKLRDRIRKLVASYSPNAQVSTMVNPSYFQPTELPVIQSKDR